MVITRISTVNTFNSTISDAIGVQSKLFTLQKQISSGVKTDQFEGLFGEIEAFTSLEDKMQRNEEFLKNNSIISPRINLMEQSLSDVIDTTTDLRNLLLLRRNGTANENLGFNNQLDQLWNTVGNSLNASIEGRYLFGGIRTDRPPVDVESFPTLFGDNNQPESGYYRGAEENVSIRLGDDNEVDIDVRADNPAVQKIYAGIAIAREGHDNNDDQLLTEAYDMISEGLDEVSLLQVNIGTIQLRVEQAAERQTQQATYWRGIRDSIISTDLVAASTEISINQGILQASFQAFARINSLQLSDFLG